MRRHKAKVIMPQNPESSIPLDDDDILDLTEIAEPGKPSGGPPEPGDGIDFGADLDALLDSLAPDGTVTAPAVSSPRMAVSQSPVAAPIKDQTPVTHKVDPNEEMPMPETSDIDSLLAELGANIPADPPEAFEAKTRATKAAAPAPNFDGLLAQARAAEAQKAAEEEAVMEKAVVEDFAGKATPAPAPDAVPKSTPSPVVPEAEMDDGDSLDLNELDALLDDILATAPEMRPPAQAVPEAAESAAPEVPAAPAVAAAFQRTDEEPEVIAVPEAALMPTDAPDASFEARIRRLEDAVEVVETEVANQFSEGEINALIDAKLRAFAAPVPEAGHGGGLSENDVTALIDAKLRAFAAPVPEAGHGEGLSESDVAALIDAKLAALFAPGSDMVSQIVDQVISQLAAPDAASETSANVREKLEKMAAAAAAKVIREEIAALMNGQS